jgi:hypothetical protein
VVNLQAAFANLIKQLVLVESYLDQRMYMQSLCKPTNMTVQQFISCIMQMCKLMTNLPCQEQEPLMTKHNFKYFVFNAHPCGFCNQYMLKYDDSMHGISMTTLGNQLAYIQHVMDCKPSGLEQPKKKQRGNGGQSHSGRSNNLRNNNSNKGSNSKRAVCQIPGHSGHIWKECHTNKQLPNYDKNFVPKTWLQDGKDGNNKSGKSKDASKLSNNSQSYLCNTCRSTITLSSQTKTGCSAPYSNNAHWMEQWKDEE